MGALTLQNYTFLKFESWELEKVTLRSLITIFPPTLRVYVKNEIFIKRLIRLNFQITQGGYNYFSISMFKSINDFFISETITYFADFKLVIFKQALASTDFCGVLERFSYYFVYYKYYYYYSISRQPGRKRKKRIDIKREKRKKRWSK